MQFLWRYIDTLIGKGLDASVFAEFLFYTTITLVPMALPLSILMSSLMTFGNLGERYELTAIKASGISLQRIMSPLIILVFFISIGAFYFANSVLPYSHLQMRSLLYDIQQLRPELQITPGVFNNLVTGYSIRVNGKDHNTGTLYGVQIYNHTEGKGNISVTIADSGNMKTTADESNLVLTLYHGQSYNELQENKVHQSRRSYPHRIERFEKQQVVIELGGQGLERTDQSLFKSHYAMMNLNQLSLMEDSLWTEVTDKKDQLYINLVRGNLFKKRDYKEYPINVSQDLRKMDITKSGPKTIEKLKSTIVVNKKEKDKKPEKVKRNITAPPKTVDSTAKEDLSKLVKPVLKEVEDSLPAKKITTINTDSLYNILTLRDKQRIMGSAITYARTAKNIVANSAQSLDYKIRYLRRYEIEWHRKFTIAFACLVFLFIGAPLGAIIRKGGLGLPLVLSIIFFIFNYILSITGEKLVRESLVPAYQGMWLTSFIFLLIGVFLTYKATTDSSMLNMDTYLNFLKKHFGQRFNVVDKISIQAQVDVHGAAKVSKIKSSLVTLQDNVNGVIEWKRKNSNLSEFVAALYSVEADPDLIQFDRYYNNTFRILINNPIFHNKSIRGKVYEFPSFSYDELTDKNWKRILRIALAFLPPLTLLVALRHFIKLQLFEAKLNKIKSLVPELLSIININFPDSTNENTSSLQ